MPGGRKPISDLAVNRQLDWTGQHVGYHSSPGKERRLLKKAPLPKETRLISAHRRPGGRKDNRKSQPLYDITVLAAPHLKRLSCSLTSGCDWSGESPDDGKFPVRPSSLTPSVVRQRAAPEAG